MKTINLFVACPKDSDNLKSLKEDIKKKCLDLNVYFANTIKEEKEDKKIKVIPVTYDDPERREEVCKQIIKHRADIVLFLFDDVYDKYLLDELEYAVELSIKFHKPEPLVYVKKSNDNSINKDLVKKIAEILAEGGWIIEPFIDSGDLWSKVLDKMERYFNQYYSIRRIQRKAKRRYYILPLLLVISLILGVVFLIKWRNAESKKLLIFGGGSARNYIEDTYLNQDSNIEKDKLIRVKPKLWWYAPMPSADAYRMIAENIINLEDDYKKSLYYPVIISASKADTNSYFRRSLSVDGFRKKGIVIGIHLGNDTLVVYGPKSDSILNSNYIDRLKLDSLILDTTLSVWRTSPNSGTFNAYCNDSICPSLKNRQNMEVFSDKGIIDSIRWIALGSAHYRPTNDTSNMFYSIVKDSSDCVYKPTFIYFVLYKDKKSNNYMLPTAMLEFLDRIHVLNKTFDSNNNPLFVDGQINPIIMTMIKTDTTTMLFDGFHSNKK